MSSLLQIEDSVDKCGVLLQSSLDNFSKSGNPFDLANWLQYYAFDTIGCITVGLVLLLRNKPAC